jgi:hypothetical protein
MTQTNFPLEEEWANFNIDFSAKLLSAADELIQAHFPDDIWNIEEEPHDANVLVRKYGAQDLTAHFFLSALNNAEKSAAAIEDWIRQIKSIGDYRTSRLALQRIGNEQYLRERTLLETLIPLIRFSDLAAHQRFYIEHYAAYREYEFMHKKRQEFDSSFASVGLSVPSPFEQKLDDICRKIASIETTQGFQFVDCWYLKNPYKQPIFNFVTLGTTYPAPSILFPSAREGIEGSLNRTDMSGLVQLEKAILGFTYQGSFGISSQDIHFSPCTFSNYFLDSFRMQRAVTAISFLAAVVICRCVLMTNHSKSGPAQSLFDNVAGPTNQPMFDAVVNPQAAVGDLLTARDINGGLLCGVVIAVTQRANRFVLYEVSQLAATTLPNQLVPSTDVLHYFQRSTITAVIDQLVTEISGSRQLPTDDLCFASAAQHQYNQLTRIAQELGGLKFGSQIMPFVVQNPD